MTQSDCADPVRDRLVYVTQDQDFQSTLLAIPRCLILGLKLGAAAKELISLASCRYWESVVPCIANHCHRMTLRWMVDWHHYVNGSLVLSRKPLGKTQKG